ncbi:hypothetical protein Tco_0890343 [Tanacetum coccineum]|uniref:Uncharacterized protein n=1 Tax=Tanacetum coccineum TaxID=301880 RepID=A0ABQ5BZU9_9ASTR
MDYFISVHHRFDVRFSALFLDPEEKSSFYPNDFPSMILQKIVCVSQGGHIAVVDILKHNKFFRAFTASCNNTAILYSTILDTIYFNSKAGVRKCQLDEQWFDLTQDTLKDALQITPVNKNRAFSPPSTPDALTKFVNELGYPREVINLSNVTTNDMFQPWRALATIINLCLTGKTSEDKRNLAHQAQGKKKATIILIPIARHQRYLAGEEVSDPDSPAPKPAKPTKQTKPKPTKQSKPTEPKAASKKPKPAPAKPKEKKCKPVSELEPDTGKLQPLPEVPGKGKEKVGEEQAAQVLLHLQTTKKKSPTEQYIFQRHTPVPSEPTGHEESSSLYMAVTQTGPNPDDVAESQPLPTPSVLAGPNLEHSDVEITDPSSQPQPEHMDEGFTAEAYPDVQEKFP